MSTNITLCVCECIPVMGVCLNVHVLTSQLSMAVESMTSHSRMKPTAVIVVSGGGMSTGGVVTLH